ncbi:hypothetical protein TNCV_1776041 [Trichonephila clavipes]|nr:hypothetical protein TNCV_1776041 [Trichonephila clavipes]
MHFGKFIPHWLRMAVQTKKPAFLCVHARMDSDHLLNALDSMNTTSSVGPGARRQMVKKAKHGRWINK